MHKHSVTIQATERQILGTIHAVELLNILCGVRVSTGSLDPQLVQSEVIISSLILLGIGILVEESAKQT